MIFNKRKYRCNNLLKIYNLPYFKIKACFKITNSSLFWIIENQIRLMSIKLYHNSNFIIPYLLEHGYFVKNLVFDRMNIYQIKNILALCKNIETVSIIKPFIIEPGFIDELTNSNISNLYLFIYSTDLDNNFIERLDIISLKFKYIEICIFSPLSEKIQKDILTKCKNIKVSSAKGNEIIIKLKN